MTEHPAGGNLALARQIWLSDGRRLVVRSFKWLLALGAVGAIVSTGMGAWRFSDLVQEEVFVATTGAEIFDHARVDNVGVDSVTLEKREGATAAITRSGIMGIRWSDGYGSLGAVLAETDESVTREFTPISGRPREGALVVVDGTVFLGDPLTDRGIEFTTVPIRGPLGLYEGWEVAGTRQTWVIYVHGRGADRTEALRLLPTTVEAGYPGLVIRYANDTDSPASGRYEYGLAEYRDLEAAIAYALDRGAEDVVLVGYSMGGAIAGEFMHASPFADRVRGLILDAPMLDLGRIIDLEAQARGVPSPLVSLAKTTVALRFGVSWSDVDYVSKLSRVTVPMLVFHGEQDDIVPIELSRALEAAAPRLVQLHEFPTAGHVQSWNVDPAAYGDAVRVFLEGLGDRAP